MPADVMPPGADLLVARLAKLDTGQVSDVLDEAGLANQVLASTLTPLQARTRFAGRGLCFRRAGHQRPACTAAPARRHPRRGRGCGYGSRH
jgi:4-hydroxy-4-methyl-2-oxoglutarate aldolase